MASTGGPSFLTSLQGFAASLTRTYGSLTKAQPEGQFKGPVQRLLEAAGTDMSLGAIVSKTKAPVEDVGRPDLAVDINGLLGGYVELKAPGIGARADKFKDRRNKEQWKKFAALSNLIYTDGGMGTRDDAGYVPFGGRLLVAVPKRPAVELVRLLSEARIGAPVAGGAGVQVTA